MADKVLQIAPLNPLRFVEVQAANPLYMSEPIDECYLQKWSTLDTTTIQVLSDYFFEFKIYSVSTGLPVLTIEPVDIQTSIIGRTFTCYEVTVPFTELVPGNYYAEIFYTDDDGQEQFLQTQAFNVATEQADTLWVQYTHSRNKFSIIFDTGIVFNLRISGRIADWTPEFNDTVFVDEIENTTKIDGEPFESYTLYSPSRDTDGCPRYLGDILNRALQCNQFSIDGEYYSNQEGQKWEVQRGDNYDLVGLTIKITPVTNTFTDEFVTGELPPEGFTPVQKILKYINNGANLSIANIFRKYSLLEKICIYNYGSGFELNVGITIGGTEIVEAYPIAAAGETVVTTPWLFASIKTLYLSGLAGTNTDIFITYKQLDADPIQIGTQNPYAGLGKGAIAIYEEINDGDLEIDFDVATGLGRPDTEWFGWAWCDGRNGTVDRTGTVPIGWSDELVAADIGAVTASMGDIVGANTKAITVSNLPPLEVTVPGQNINSPGGRVPFNGGGNGEVDLPVKGQNGETPSGALFNVIQKSVVSLYVKKITDNE